MKRKFFPFFSLIIIILTLFVVCAATMQPEGVPSESSNNTSLLFLGNMNIAPVVFLDVNTPKGVGVDIVHALENHISRPIEIRAMNWSEAQSLVARGDADALNQINPTDFFGFEGKYRYLLNKK